jgi:hypothetical protein
MSDPYRNEISPLRTQLSALRAEIAGIDGRLGEADELRKRRAEVAAEVADLEKRLRNLETQTTLDGLRIASPCKASWDDMVGDDRVRFCGQSAKNVFNVAAMTRDEAYDLMRANEAQSVCMRLHRRADGTVMTSDCPEGAKKKRVRRLALVAGGLAAAAGGALFAMGDAQTMGEIAPVAGGVRMPEARPEAVPMGVVDVAPVGSVVVPAGDPPVLGKVPAQKPVQKPAK